MKPRAKRGSSKRAAGTEPFNILLDPSDRADLERLVTAERLNRSDIVRRLIRAAARRLDRRPDQTPGQLATG